jgi:hypothetical protein
VTSVKVPSWLLWKRFFELRGEFLPVDEEDVGPAVVVVVEDGDAGAGGFYDVALAGGGAVDVDDGDAGFGGDVDEPGWGWVLGGWWVGLLGLSGDKVDAKQQQKRDAGPSTAPRTMKLCVASLRMTNCFRR